MKKIIILGNSGSGKTWLGKKLSTVRKTPYIALDDIFWEPGGFNKKRKKIDVKADIRGIQESKCWIVEGVFGHLVEPLIPFADTLIYLDIPWKECKKNLIKRGSESSKQRDHVIAEDKFQKLLVWASEYDTRESKASKNYHCSLLDCFSGEKHRICNRDEINLFLGV